MARGVSAKYPTGGSKIIVDDMLRSSGQSLILLCASTSVSLYGLLHGADDSAHSTMLGAATTKAYDEVHHRRKTPTGLKRRSKDLALGSNIKSRKQATDA